MARVPVNKMIWVCLKIGYIPNEIAIFHRDNDQQNHWVKRGTLFSDTPGFYNPQFKIKAEKIGSQRLFSFWS
jgi:hypothetical protein